MECIEWILQPCLLEPHCQMVQSLLKEMHQAQYILLATG